MLKFKETFYSELIKDTKYIIIPQKDTIEKENIYIGIFDGFCNNYSQNEISCWKKTYLSYLSDYNKKFLYGTLEMNKYTMKRKYMTLKSQKDIIQNNMENRAINIILKQLIGDINFFYA